MPLPAALLRRLTSRGIVNKEAESKDIDQTENTNTESEEIIAEDYDDVDPSQYDYEPVKKPAGLNWIERMKRRIVEGNNTGYKGCPNKYNIFHKCTLFCVNRWGDGILEPSRAYLKRRNRLIKKYPLPKNWLEIYDYGCGVYYYWNTSDDTVSWLPPDHPKTQISKSSAALRRELEEVQPPGEEEAGENDTLTEADIQKILDSPMPPVTMKRPASPLPTDNSSGPTMPKKPKARDLDKAISRYKSSRNKNKSGTKVGLDPLDPMDPASYSDVPRGKWSDGLNTEGSKTGVDPTATGVVFQMRPYPSPGAVLQANAASKAENN